MALTQTQYRDIMDDYEKVRRRNYAKMQSRLDQVYQTVPAIKEIDDTIASESLAVAREMIFHPDLDKKTLLHERVKGLIEKKRDLLIKNRYPADYLDPIYRCSYCKDTGYVDSQKCFCFEQKMLDIIYSQSNLMGAVKEHNFTTFKMDYYSDQASPGRKSPRENMKQVLDVCLDYIRNFKNAPDRNLLIHGNPGVGKTFLTTCIANELMKAGHSVIYLTSYQLFEQLADYKFRRENQNADTLPNILNADLLIIDDLGTEMNNAFINSELFLCINERILNKKSTIISTNFNLKQLNQVYTERISSRLIQFYTILHIYGEDIRVKKAFSPID